MEIFEEGQLVVKRLGLVGVNKQKLRHLWCFGCRCAVQGNKVTALSDGPVFLLKGSYAGGKKRKPKEYITSVLEGVYIETFPTNDPVKFAELVRRFGAIESPPAKINKLVDNVFLVNH